MYKLSFLVKLYKEIKKAADIILAKWAGSQKIELIRIPKLPPNVKPHLFKFI